MLEAVGTAEVATVFWMRIYAMPPPSRAGSGLGDDSRAGAPVSSTQPVEYGLPVPNSLGPVSWLPAVGVGQSIDERTRASQEAAIGGGLYRQAKFAEACDHYRHAVRLCESEPN